MSSSKRRKQTTERMLQTMVIRVNKARKTTRTRMKGKRRKAVRMPVGKTISR